MARETGTDVESTGDGAYLRNTTVHDFSWNALGVDVDDRATGGNKSVLSSVRGHVEAGSSIFLCMVECNPRS